MRNRLAMGRSPQPRLVGPIGSVTVSASSVQSHPRVGQKGPRTPPESAPAASTTGQSTESPLRRSPTKGKEKRKKKRRKDGDISPPRSKKPKKEPSPAASSDTDIYVGPAAEREEAPMAAPPESSDSQAEVYTNRSDSDGTESAPESKKVSSSRR